MKKPLNKGTLSRNIVLPVATGMDTAFQKTMPKPRHGFARPPSRAMQTHNTTLPFAMNTGKEQNKTARKPQCGFAKLPSRAAPAFRKGLNYCYDPMEELILLTPLGPVCADYCGFFNQLGTCRT